VDVSNNRSCAYAPYIMKMIEKLSKKTFVKNILHTKHRPNKQFTSIKPVARTQISPPDSPNNYRGSGLGLLIMLRGIFTACKASKDVIIKSQEVILRNQHILHHKLQITECDTSSVTIAAAVFIQCLTMYYRSLNEILV
jgi:hypothetical protein